MANISNPLPYLTKREYGFIPDIKSQLFNERLNAAKNLFRRDLVCHFGCVNAIEFSSNGELLVSGGDDRRVMLWQFGQAIHDHGKPEPMKAIHQSNIFCLGMTNDGQKIYSGGNDDIVIVHDVESKCPLEVLQHQRAVCSLSIDPFNERVVGTAGNDGRLLLFDTRQSVHESLVIARSRKAFHGVMFHPHQMNMLVSANARDGCALWDIRSTKHPVLRYVGNNGTCQNSMSVRFNSAGTHILGLRRRMAPVLYAVHSPEPVAEFYHQDYYNSCTMKSCCFAGKDDQFVLSGSDDFNLYMWKIPEFQSGYDMVVEPPHIVLYGHRSIVNQVRYNPHYCMLASSGVEKIIKVWSALEYPQMRGTLLEEAQGSDNPREIYSHEDYVSLVHDSAQVIHIIAPGGHRFFDPRRRRSQQLSDCANRVIRLWYISHNYAEQSTREDQRMMAFFDSLVQRELECLAEETDSLDGSSSPAANDDSDDSDRGQPDFLPLQNKRANPNGNRSQRGPNRMARLVPSRYPKKTRSQKRGTQSGSVRRRNKTTRPCKPAGGAGGSGAGGTRLAGRRARPVGPPAAPALPSAPSSERTDSDEPAHSRYGRLGRIVRPLRRRTTMTRTTKRKTKTANYRKKSNGTTRPQTNDNANFNEFDNNLSLPSTSTGYRGQSSALFRIAEVDSDDDQSASSRPISPRQNSHQVVPANLIGIMPMPMPINGSRDSLGESLRLGPPDLFTLMNSPREMRTRIILRRVRRHGRLLGLPRTPILPARPNTAPTRAKPPAPPQQRSDSSESPSPKDQPTTSTGERLSPRHNATVARLMNETNESELESSCSTEGSAWPSQEAATPDSGVDSSSRTAHPQDDVSDDPDYPLKFRQRVKKARRNYRDHMDSDSN